MNNKLTSYSEANLIEYSAKSKTVGVLAKARDLAISNYQTVEFLDVDKDCQQEITTTDFKAMWTDTLKILQDHINSKPAKHKADIVLKSQIFASELTNYELIDICVALKWLINNKKYMPTLADIREALPAHCREFDRLLNLLPTQIELAKTKKEVRHLYSAKKIAEAKLELDNILLKAEKAGEARANRLKSAYANN